MKIIPKILGAVLILSGLMPLSATFFATTNQPKIMEMFQLSAPLTPELQTVIVLFGAALIFAAVIQFLAAAWVLKGREEGLRLSFWVGIMLVATGIYMFAALSNLGVNNSNFYVIDLVKGGLIIALTIISRKKLSLLSP